MNVTINDAQRHTLTSPPGLSHFEGEGRKINPLFALIDVEDFFHPDGQRHLIASLPTQYVFDNRDDKLDPKRGFRALARKALLAFRRSCDEGARIGWCRDFRRACD